MADVDPEGFWAWFTANEPRISSAYDSDDRDQLGALFAYGMTLAGDGLNWELGPYAHPKRALVLSPATREKIPAVQRLAAAAPKLEGWRFFAGKPPKALQQLVFVVGEVRVDAERWRYRLTSYNQGEFVDVALFALVSDSPPEHLVETFCELLVESLIGELKRLDRVGTIDFTAVASRQELERHIPIRDLREHLNRVLISMS